MFEVVANIRLRNRWALIAIALLISVSVSLMQYFFQYKKMMQTLLTLLVNSECCRKKLHGMVISY